MAIAHEHSTGRLITVYSENYDKSPIDGYYWIKLRNDHWFVGELRAGDWYVCGMERCLSHSPIEIGQRIERI